MGCSVDIQKQPATVSKEEEKRPKREREREMQAVLHGLNTRSEVPHSRNTLAKLAEGGASYHLHLKCHLPVRDER